jgi:hypothetical protein
MLDYVSDRMSRYISVFRMFSTVVVEVRTVREYASLTPDDFYMPGRWSNTIILPASIVADWVRTRGTGYV